MILFKKTFLKKTFPILFFLSLLFLDLSCGPSKKDQELTKAAQELKKIADHINNDFSLIRKEIKTLADQVTELYQKDNIEKQLKTIDRSKYRLHENGVFYKHHNDGSSAVFVSGHTLVNQEIKKIVYFTEPLDLIFTKIIKTFPEIVQTYYNDKNSYNRIYPYFDVLTQYEPKMNIPTFNFYYLADKKHNPQKKAVWVKEPYVDPAGRGWMVSVIAPVYINGELEGVPGFDVTINTITDRYVRQKHNMMILDANGMIVFIQEYLANLLSLPTLKDHKYLETIKSDTYLPNDFNILHSKSRSVREMATLIFKENQNITEFKKGAETFIVMTDIIPEMDWKILKFSPK